VVLLSGGFDKKALLAEKYWLLLGGTALGLNWVALFEAYRMLNISLATLIYYAGPMLILLFSPLLFKEKLTGRKLLSVCIVAVGLVGISGSILGGKMSLSGLIFAAASAILYASVIVLNKKIFKTKGLQTAALELDIAFFVVLFYVAVTCGFSPILSTDLPYVAIMGLVNTGLAYLLYFSSVQKLPAQSVALISYVDPVLALIFSALILCENMTVVQIVGAVLIIGGAILGEIKERK